MLKKTIDLIKYLFSKTTELGDLEAKDALLAKTVLDIHFKKTDSTFITVPLFSLNQIHAIDRDNAIQATQERVVTLQRVKNLLLKKKDLTRDVLAEHLPSVSWIKVVRQSDNNYIAYEGNGRLVALQQVFDLKDNINVEVEEYDFKNPKKILNRMEKVRRLNGFTS
jgi:hypothetical protein